MRRETQMDLYLWLAGTAIAVALIPIASFIESISHNAKIGTILVTSIIAILCLGRALTLAWKDKEDAPKIERPRMIPLIGMIVFGAGFIGFAAWYFWPSEQKPPGPYQSVTGMGSPTPAPLAPVAAGPSNDFLELKCEAAEHFILPPDGRFYSLEATSTEDNGSVGFVSRWVSEFAARSGPHILPGANSTLKLCTITNYSEVPIFNLRTIIKVDFLNTTTGNGGIGGAGIRFSRNAEMNVPKIEAKGMVQFYASANSPLIVWINLPETVEIQRLGTNKRESVRFIRIDPAYFTLTGKFWFGK